MNLKPRTLEFFACWYGDYLRNRHDPDCERYLLDFINETLPRLEGRPLRWLPTPDNELRPRRRQARKAVRVW